MTTDRADTTTSASPSNDVTKFTERHEEQLRDYFGGVYAGRMGIRSWMGPMLDHARSVAPLSYERDDDAIPIRSSGRATRASDTEMDLEALDAARDERRVRAALREMTSAEIRVLRLVYTPRPPAALPAAVLVVVGEAGALALARRLVGEDRDARARARKDVASIEHRAGLLLEEAKAAYAIAERAIRELEKAERMAKFAQAMRRSA